MSPRWWLLVLVPLFAGGLWLPDALWTVWGRVNDESFYRGRPTSYWRSDLERWQPVFT